MTDFQKTSFSKNIFLVKWYPQGSRVEESGSKDTSHGFESRTGYMSHFYFGNYTKIFETYFRKLFGGYDKSVPNPQVVGFSPSIPNSYLLSKNFGYSGFLIKFTDSTYSGFESHDKLCFRIQKFNKSIFLKNIKINCFMSTLSQTGGADSGHSCLFVFGENQGILDIFLQLDKVRTSSIFMEIIQNTSRLKNL